MVLATPTQHPIRLDKDTIMEAVCELRFDGTPSVSSILPGLLFSKMRDWVTTSERLLEVPQELAEQTPTLKYRPTHRLRGGGVVVVTGEHTLGFACSPYLGWQEFKSRIQKAWGDVASFGLIRELSRVSLKYINIIEIEEGSDIRDVANVEILIGEKSLRNEKMTFRVETEESGIKTVVQVANPATGDTGENRLSGCLVDIDIIMEIKSGPELLTDNEEVLENLHKSAKSAYFSILSSAALKRRGPVYG